MIHTNQAKTFSTIYHCCQHCIMTLGHDLQPLTARATSSASMILSCGLSLGGFPTQAGQSMTSTIESLPDITLRQHETCVNKTLSLMSLFSYSGLGQLTVQAPSSCRKSRRT